MRKKTRRGAVSTRALRGLAGASVGALSLIMGGPSCSDTEGAVAPSELTLPAGATLRYELAWSWEGASWDGTAYAFVTDQGYEVRIEAAYVGSLSLELRACDELAWLAPLPAWADHQSEHDASLALADRVENAFETQVREHALAPSSGARYCRLHWVVGPIAASAPDGFAMSGAVALRGSFRAAAGETRSFDVRGTLAAGGLRDLGRLEPEIASEAIAADDGSFAAARVRLIRHPARALDGEDLASLGDAELAYAFLRGLCNSAVARWQLAP